MKHLRASDRSGFKRGGMKREYWQEWRAKAKADLRKKMEEAENEEEGGDCVS